MNDTLTLSPGYYWTWDSPQTNQTSYLQFIKNLANESELYDNETTNYEADLPTASKCPKKEACLGGLQSLCAPGYKGPLCMLCETGYYQHLGFCRRCSTRATSLLQMIPSSLTLVALVVITSLCKHESLSHSEMKVLSGIKTAVCFCQTIALGLGTFDFKTWPNLLSSYTYYLKLFQLNLSASPPFKCTWAIDTFNPFTNFSITMVTNLTTVSLSATLSLFKMIASRKNSDKDNKPVSAQNSPIHRIVFLLTLLYLPTCFAVLQVLPTNCHSFCTNERVGNCPQVLGNNLQVPCYTDEHHKYLKFAYLALVYIIAFPLLTIALHLRPYPVIPLCLKWKSSLRKRKVGDKAKSQTESAVEKPSMSTPEYVGKTVQSSCFLVGAGMIKDLSYAVVLVSSGASYRTKLTLAAGVLFAYSVIRAMVQPYKKSLDNWLDLTTQQIACWTLVAGLLLFSGDTGDGNSSTADQFDSVLQVAIVAGNIVVFLLLFGELVLQWNLP